jgi:hypothetical protein
MAKLSRENKASRPAATRIRRLAKAAAEKPAARRRKSSGESPYHHGDLHEALLKAAEQVLERDGLPACRTPHPPIISAISPASSANLPRSVSGNSMQR